MKKQDKIDLVRKVLHDFTPKVYEYLQKPPFNLEHAQHGIACEEFSKIREQFLKSFAETIQDERLKKNKRQSTVLSKEALDKAYSDYDSWCIIMYEGEFFVKWLTRDEFFDQIKTSSDWKKLQIEVGMIE